MCVVDLDRCDCSCHYMEGVAHMMPCCYTCPKCGQNKSFLTVCSVCESDICHDCLPAHQEACKRWGEGRDA